jgi:hypothetical protein
MPELPNFDPHDFKAGQPIDNPYFPLKEGLTYHYRGEALNDADKLVPSPDNQRVQHVFKQIDGVQALVVYDNVYLNGLQQEATQDYYAQDVHGSVWYLGEYESEFVRDKHGKIIKVSHEGSWEAGVNGAKPGYIMPAHPKVGFAYFQEHAPGVALDSAKVTATDLTLNVQGKVYRHVVLTQEFTPLEPTVSDYKWYAPGVGMVLEREYTNGKLDAFSYFVGVTPNGGTSVGTLDHGVPSDGAVQLASVPPWAPGHDAGGEVAGAETSAYLGIPPVFPVGGHAPMVDLPSLF